LDGVIIARRNVEKIKFRKSGSENLGSSWQSRQLHRTALASRLSRLGERRGSLVALGSNQLEQNTVIRAFMMVASFPPGYVFSFFAGMMVLQLIGVKTMVPKTKGVPSEQIQRQLGIE